VIPVWCQWVNCKLGPAGVCDGPTVWRKAHNVRLVLDRIIGGDDQIVQQRGDLERRNEASVASHGWLAIDGYYAGD
jgi:hypothetical protein